MGGVFQFVASETAIADLAERYTGVGLRWDSDHLSNEIAMNAAFWSWQSPLLSAPKLLELYRLVQLKEGSL